MRDVPVGYFVTVGLMGWCVAHCLWVPRRRGPLASVNYFSSMVINEIPVFGLYWLVASTILAVAQGDLATSSGPAAMLGLLGCVVTAAGLVVLVRRAATAGPALDRALAESLGEDWRDDLPPAPAYSRWRPLLNPFRRRRRDVDHLRNLAYGEHRLQRLDVYRRRLDRPAAMPVFVQLHGGAFVSGRKDRESLPLLYRLAAGGWLCVSANYRIGRGAHFPDHLVDLKRVIAWVRAHAAEYGADPRLIVVAGNSAGGHLAVTAALTQNDPVYQPGFEDADTGVAAAVGLYGYYGRIESSVPASSPAGHFRADAPPILLVHGDHDSSVPVARARDFASSLRATSDGPVVYAELPGAQHTFDLLASTRSLVAAEQVAAFASWVRLRSERRAKDG